MRKQIRSLTRSFVRSLRFRRGAIIAAWSLIAASAWISFAAAQYTFNPAAADEAPGIRYFGSAKDEKGALLPGVGISIVVAGQRLNFISVTGDDGRFRIIVPLDMPREKTTVKCFKTGLQLVRMTQRAGPRKGPQKTIQVDCVLRVATSE